MNRLWENARSRPLAVAVAIAAPLLVILWHLFALATRPPHFNQIVAELGSTMRFVANPSPNHADTHPPPAAYPDAVGYEPGCPHDRAYTFAADGQRPQLLRNSG